MLLLIDKPMAEIGFRTAAADPEATVVLIQDGVYLDPATELEETAERSVYAVERDLSVRGVAAPTGVEPIEYDALIERILDQEVKSFV
jgi:tRNA 2-thiouridine synthesizing protein B